MLGTEGERTVYTGRGFELQSEVSEVVHCVEKEDKRGNLIHNMEGGRQGDTSGTISGSYVAALYGAWMGVAGEKSKMVGCAGAWKVLGCCIEECGHKAPKLSQVPSRGQRLSSHL